MVRYPAIAILVLLLGTGGDAAQVDTTPPVDATQGIPGTRRPQPRDEQQIRAEKARLKKANNARQAEIRKDTDKLLQLATQLKQYVDKSNENTLSLDVVKKADEIEKLAKNVKEKMKMGY